MPRGGAPGFIEDNRLAQATRIALGDVRNWLETLDSDEYINLARTEVGLSASITAKGRLVLGVLPIAPSKQSVTSPSAGPSPTTVSPFPAVRTILILAANPKSTEKKPLSATLPSPGPATSSIAKPSAGSSGMWVVLDGKFFEAETVHEKGGMIEVVAASESADVDAVIKSLRTPLHGSPKAIGYAHGNDAMFVRVKEIGSRTESGKKRWFINLAVVVAEPVPVGGRDDLAAM